METFTGLFNAGVLKLKSDSYCSSDERADDYLKCEDEALLKKEELTPTSLSE